MDKIMVLDLCSNFSERELIQIIDTLFSIIEIGNKLNDFENSKLRLLTLDPNINVNFILI